MINEVSRHFESLLPLALLLPAVLLVVILYLLKPKGRDYKISSNLLWDKLFKNQESKTFFEKFVHNILMYVQILVIFLLVLALMSPYLQREGKNGGDVILVLDTSGSMQHDTGEGRTRLEEALRRAEDIIAASEETAFSVITSDCMGANLLAAGVKDKSRLYELLGQIECCDGEGRLQAAESIVDTLRGNSANAAQSAEAAPAEVIVFTDGNGAEDAMSFSEYFDARVIVVGEKVSNVANNFLSYSFMDLDTDASDAEERAADGGRPVVCASGITNYSDSEASMEVSLYEGKKLREVRQLTLGAGETTLCFFEEFEWKGEPLRSEISSVRFAGESGKSYASFGGDSLSGDNTAYAVQTLEGEIEAVLIGGGNTYIEKAYQAAAGGSLTKVKSEALLQMQSDGQDDRTQTVRIYDAGETCEIRDEGSMLIFGDDTAADTVERVLLTVEECDLTSGLSSFSIGVNKTKVYEVPDWGIGFLWAGEKCAGYYGEHDGIKAVVVGFDVRESDFPLRAEFPVFISNALHFLSDTSLLAESVYAVGDKVLFHPQADFDVGMLSADTRKAGLYEVAAGDIAEHYVVRFATGSQSDGRITKDGIYSAEGAADGVSYGGGIVKRQLRKGILVLALLLMALEWVLYVRQTRYRGKFYLAVRLVGAALLLLALFGVSVLQKNGVNTTIFLVDISNSNEQNLSAMETYLDEAISRMPRKNQYGIVTFGKNSLVDQFLTKEERFSQIMSLPDKTATNFEEAMSRALAMLPPEGAGRVVVLTDGRETKGEIANTASALAAKQVELLAHVYEVSQGQDAYVDNVELPGYLYQGDAYSMTVTVESNYETDAVIQIWKGTILAEEHDVHLNRGTNRFRFRQRVTGENVESLEAKVVAAGDTCEENNGYHAYAAVDTLPKVLLINGMKEDSSQFENLLRSAGCDYNRVSARNAPVTLERLLEFKSVLLENVYLADLPEGFLEIIETYVKDYGFGLICCGGDESYALGGYRDSVLETVLPVDMELRGVDEIPTTAMIMVIDRSGSMGINSGYNATNLDLAITAAKTAVDQMRDTDYVGVLAFDDRYAWVVEPTPASDRKAIKDKIETIMDGGGTTIKPALWAALSGVQECEADIRHVILLTDGQGEGGSFNDVTSSYKNAGITLSAVAVGEGSDQRLLEQIAKACDGRYYYSDMASDIPKIFAQEVFLSGDTYLQNGEFRLAVNSGNEIMTGLFENGWPNIYGYVSATPKNVSRVLIASEKDDPILTIMQYGLGHTVAWNTDVKNAWTAAYAGESDYAQLWKRVIEYSVGNVSGGEDTVDVTTAGGFTEIVYTAPDYGQQTKVEAVYTEPDGGTWTVPLQATAPGRYEARLDTDKTGLYNVSVRRVDEGKLTNSVTTMTAVQYSDEYKFDVETTAFTSFVERYGRLFDPKENIWNQRKSGARERYDLTKWLILLGLAWFLADIAMRRFHFLPQNTRLYREIRERLRLGENRAGEKTAAESNVAAGGDAADNKAATAKGEKQREQQTLDTSALLKKKNQRG